MPGHICAVVVTTLVLEGWSSKLDPTHSVMDQVSAIVAPGTSGWAQRLSMAVDEVMLDQTSTRMLAC
jgi:aarF domain-containing kinase